jgi:hypothetical protein
MIATRPKPHHAAVAAATVLVMTLAVGWGCGGGERRDREGAGGQPEIASDSFPPETSSVATPSAAATASAAPAVIAFPTDRDTTRLARQLAGSAPALPACGSGVPPITPDSIGPFRLGVSITELARVCPRLVYGWTQISDGIPVATVAARVGGATVTALASDSLSTATLTRVEVSGAGPRTPEGLGVGATLAALQQAYGAPQASESDCVLLVWFDSRPGLAFHLDVPPDAGRECGGLSEPPLPVSLRVASVILVPR